MMKTNRRDFFKKAGISAITGSCLLEYTGKVPAQETPHPASKSKEYSPGEKIPASGIYEVTHDKLDGDDHAQQQRVTLIAGNIFPHCKVCSEWVRFRLHQAAENVETATHFVL